MPRIRLLDRMLRMTRSRKQSQSRTPLMWSGSFQHGCWTTIIIIRMRPAPAGQGQPRRARAIIRMRPAPAGQGQLRPAVRQIWWFTARQASCHVRIGALAPALLCPCRKARLQSKCDNDMEIRATLLGIDLDFQLGVALASRPACAGRQGGYLYFYIIICPRLRSAVGTIGLRVIHNWAQLQSSASFSSFRCPSPAPAMEPIRRSYFTINRRDREFMGVGDPIEMHACPERCGQRLGHGLVGRPGVVQGSRRKLLHSCSWPWRKRWPGQSGHTWASRKCLCG